MVKACGYFTRISQLPSLFPSSPGRKIPDQVIFDWQDNENLATDTAISSPVAACFLDAGSARVPLRTAERREARKTRDYRAMCRRDEMGFTPLVFEVFGAWGTCMQGFFQAAVDAVSNRLEEDVLTSWTCTTFSTFWMQRISCALAKGVVRCIRLRARRDFMTPGMPPPPPPRPRPRPTPPPPSDSAPGPSAAHGQGRL